MATIFTTGDNNFSTAKWIVNSTAGLGTHTTIASALTSSSSGDTIFIFPGTYTENLTLKVGVNLTAFTGDNNTPNVTIIGKATLTTAGTVTISNVRLQTNSDFLLAVTGSVASIAILNNCDLNASNNTGISFTSSSATSAIYCYGCTGDLGTTGIGIFAHSATGSLFFYNSIFKNTGGSSTANTASAGGLNYFRSNFSNPITSSGTAAVQIDFTNIETAAQNVTCFTAGGSGVQSSTNSKFLSGTASAISVGATLTISGSAIDSTNTNAVTGAGTINYAGLNFMNTSSLINTTTKGSRNTLSAGISFDGGTNVLSTYTVGTFTPTVVGASVTGTTTYVIQNGYYTKIGNLVSITGDVGISAATGTGNALLSALPFTVKNQSNYTASGSIIMSGAASWTWPAGTTSLALDPISNTTTATVFISGTAGAGSNLQIANASNNFYYNVCHQV